MKEGDISENCPAVLGKSSHVTEGMLLKISMDL